jgi:hypothetical protein
MQGYLSLSDQVGFVQRSSEEFCRGEESKINGDPLGNFSFWSPGRCEREKSQNDTRAGNHALLLLIHALTRMISLKFSICAGLITIPSF